MPSFKPSNEFLMKDILSFGSKMLTRFFHVDYSFLLRFSVSSSIFLSLISSLWCGNHTYFKVFTYFYPELLVTSCLSTGPNGVMWEGWPFSLLGRKRRSGCLVHNRLCLHWALACRFSKTWTLCGLSLCFGCGHPVFLMELGQVGIASPSSALRDCMRSPCVLWRSWAECFRLTLCAASA